MALKRAFSVDQDGCFLNHAFFQLKDVIAANKDILDLWRETADQYVLTELFLGSNRQSVFDDRLNGLKNQTGSCFPLFLQLADYLGAIANRFLLTDLFNGLDNNTSMDQALSHLNTDDNHYDSKRDKGVSFPDWPHDESKLIILIAQMYQFAQANPEDALVFYFVDDRHDILTDLSNFFHKYPQYIPDNMDLMPIHYAGPSDENGRINNPLSTPYPSIKGEGKLQHDVSQLIKHITSTTIQSLAFQTKEPVDRNGTPVKNYADAERTGFHLSASLNCAQDFTPLSKKKSHAFFSQIKRHLSSGLLPKFNKKKPVLANVQESHDGQVRIEPEEIQHWTSAAEMGPQKNIAPKSQVKSKACIFSSHRLHQIPTSDSSEEENDKVYEEDDEAYKQPKR